MTTKREREANKRRAQQYRAAHPERVRAAARKYAKSHPEVVAKAVAKWRKRHPKQHRAIKTKINLRRNGLTLEQYDAMLAAQNGVCAICLRPETTVLHGRVSRLSIDHDHVTNKVRGLLCNRCNPMLGYSQDAPAILRAAAAYLERHK